MNKLTALSLHGFVYSNNFGDMLLATIARQIIGRHAPEATLALPFATNIFLREAGMSSSTGWAALLRSNALLYHGGGYFGFSSRFEWRTRLRLFNRFYTPALVAARLGKPYGIFGVGVGPIHTAAQEYAVRHVFDGAIAVTVRDEESYDWLRRVGVRHSGILPTADLALTLSPRDLPPAATAAAASLLSHRPMKHYIGLHLSAPSDTSSAHSSIMNAILTFVERHKEFGIVILCDHVAGANEKSSPQYRAAQELAAKIGKRAVFVAQPPLWTLVALLAQLDGLITNKLHTGIVSSAFGRRVVSIAKNDKNFRFFRQIEAPNRCISVAQADSVDMVKMLEDGFQSLHVSTPIPVALRALAQTNETSIRAFLNSVAAGTA